MEVDEKIEEILRTEDGRKLREWAWEDFRKTAKLVESDPEAPFIIWPAINREPYQAWLPVLLMQLVRLKIRNWDKSRSVVVFGVPSSGSWYGQVLEGVKVLERDGWQVKYAEVVKAKNHGGIKGWRIGVPSYVHSRKQDGSRGKEEMVVSQPEMFRGATVVALDDAIAEGLTLKYLGEAMKQELGVAKLVVAGAMAKEMQGGRRLLEEDKLIDKVVTLVEVTKEVLNDLDR